jgi:pimeloyl-ACP methyl ester carboxylesterase
MTAVFVHGVPETTVIWDPLIAALGLDDAKTLALPGFGCPTPDEFEPTMYRYADWLAEELGAIEGPIDLVTHDWGAFLSMRVLSERPALARSWVTDMGDLNDDFEWHDTARTWQTAGEGEAFMEVFLGGTDEERAGVLTGLGIAEATARPLATQIDVTMGDAILTLYRSATGLGREWGPGIDRINAPTLVIEAAMDPFRSEGATTRLVERIGASTVRLEDQGHWWMTGDPETAAASINDFWAANV